MASISSQDLATLLGRSSPEMSQWEVVIKQIAPNLRLGHVVLHDICDSCIEKITEAFEGEEVEELETQFYTVLSDYSQQASQVRHLRFRSYSLRLKTDNRFEITRMNVADLLRLYAVSPAPRQDRVSKHRHA